jgi:DNA-binding NtrC family response regulator
VVAATNSDLEAAVEAGRFRNDLYYRLKVVTLEVPPLRERREDVPLLLRHFLEIFAIENGRTEMRFSAEALRCLVRARWDGNVRELRNLVESLVVLAVNDLITVHDLPEEYQSEDGDGAPKPPATQIAPSSERAATLSMEEIERRAILDALERTGGNRTQAAGLLGIGLRTLQRKLREYRLAGRDEPE